MPARLTDLSTASLRLLQIHLGGDRNFCYLAGDPATGQAAALDPAYRVEEMATIARDQDLRVSAILITHGHADHASGAVRLAELTGGRVYAGTDARVPGAEGLDDAGIRVGELTVAAIDTPGHSPGHTCYLAAGHLFTGDLLFCGKVGGTGAHFPGSSAEAEWASLHRLLALADDTVVLPGHDYYGGAGEMPHSTIGHERRHNPFLLCPDFAAFVALKENWADYKKRHGLR